MKTPAPNKAGTSAGDRQNSTPYKFVGTANPREIRAILALLRRPTPREHLDKAVGCSNGPDVIANLRAKGLPVRCSLIDDLDRDGRPVKRGVYHLESRAQRLLRRWLGSAMGLQP